LSRSRRKTPIIGWAADTDALWKRIYNRAMRRSVRAILRSDPETEQELPKLRDVSNPYDGEKDGKHYMHNEDTREKWLRK